MGIFGKLFTKKYGSVTVQEALERQQNGAILVDVRETHEFRSGHAAKAKTIPLGSLTTRLRELRNDKDILVICQSGARSARAASLLAENGYTVFNVSGGTMSWSRHGLPMAR